MKLLAILLAWLCALLADIQYRMLKYHPQTDSDRRFLIQEAIQNSQAH